MVCANIYGSIILNIDRKLRMRQHSHYFIKHINVIYRTNKTWVRLRDMGIL